MVIGSKRDPRERCSRRTSSSEDSAISRLAVKAKYARRVNTVGELMTSEVLTVAPEDTIGETAQKMVELGVSSAVVS
mgnify:CR=1 FL=1